MTRTWRFVIAVAIASATSTIFAQSLADIARQEEARRDSIRKTSKTFTNSSLSDDPDQRSAAARTKVPPSTPPLPAPPGNASPAVEAPTAVKAETVPDEKQWRSQAAKHWALIAVARKEVAALAGASHEDPREQALLDALRKRRQLALAQAEESQRRFERQADASQVPRAWLQEPSQ